MASPQLDVLLSTVAESLDATFETDGSPRPLSSFDGVVPVEHGRPVPERAYRWRAVSLGDSYGIELESSEGTVHTHSLSYFGRELVADRYRPALVDEGIVVATRVEAVADDEADADTEPRTARADDAGDDDATNVDSDGADVDDDASSPTSTDVTESTADGDEPAAEGSTPSTADDAGSDSDTDADADAAPAPDADADADASDEEDARAEISRLEAVATDPTYHEYVRENAVRELAEFGDDAADALERVAEADVDGRQGALAATLRAELDADA